MIRYCRCIQPSITNQHISHCNACIMPTLIPSVDNTGTFPAGNINAWSNNSNINTTNLSPMIPNPNHNNNNIKLNLLFPCTEIMEVMLRSARNGYIVDKKVACNHRTKCFGRAVDILPPHHRNAQFSKSIEFLYLMEALCKHMSPTK